MPITIDAGLKESISKGIKQSIDSIIGCYIEAPLQAASKTREEVINGIITDAIKGDLTNIRFDNLLKTENPTKPFPTLPFIKRSNYKENKAVISAYYLWALCQGKHTKIASGYHVEERQDPNFEKTLFEEIVKFAKETASSYSTSAIAAMQSALTEKATKGISIPIGKDTQYLSINHPSTEAKAASTSKKTEQQEQKSK
jgi:hypothetical protein